MICAACGLIRDPDDLIAFWPVGHPGQVRYACRVTRPSPVAQESCFRAVVRSVFTHVIGPAFARGGLITNAKPFLDESGCALVVPA